MSISTGKGDNGKTYLFTGENINKDDIRVEAYGQIDELLSFISEAKHYIINNEIKKIIEKIQLDLYKVSSELASKKGDNYNKLKIFFLNSGEYNILEDYITKFENIIKIKGFVLPGTTIGSAKLDICRAISRRAERTIIKLDREEKVSDNLKKYMNRLSDLFFILARYEEFCLDKIIYKKDL